MRSEHTLRREEHKCMNSDSLVTNIVVQGESLPMLEVMMYYGGSLKGYVLMTKDQAVALTHKLQSMIAEM